MALLSEREALLAGVLAEPDADAPRLVYADWLEENGDDSDRSRAEFIRCQLHLDRLGGYGACRDPRRGSATVGCGECDLCVFCRQHDNLLNWVRFWGWFGPVVTAGGSWPGSPAVSIHGPACEVGYFNPKERLRWKLVVRRGFVEEISCPLADWRGYSAHWWELTPLRVYRPITTAASPRDEILAQGVGFWQDENVGRLDTLDLTALCRRYHQSDLGYFQAQSRHAFRPWRGLRRVLLPGDTAPYERGTRLAWERLLPGVRVEFAPAQEADDP